jgi:triosephosphate isomerase
MNPSTAREAKNLFAATLRASRRLKKAELVICPPFPWLAVLLKRRQAPWLGSQDIFWAAKSGPFTGEVSPGMLLDLGCRYAIVGHSERKRHLGETDEMINRKVLAGLEAGLKIVLCVGEWRREDDRRTSVVDRTIEDQFLRATEKLPALRANNLIVAYEPVWAIGTGNTDTPDDAMQAALLIRKLAGRRFGRKIGDKFPVLYGGSVNSKNIREFIKEEHLDGVLVGSASADVKEFTALLKLI